MDSAIRLRSEENERRILSPKACLAAESRGRLRPEPACEIRTCFQRDRDRIIHCRSFRRLKHKTQVFLASEASDFVNGLILYVDGGILAYIGKQPG